MKGYFGIGVQGVNKGANVGALMRTAHAFGASFVFTVDAQIRKKDVRAADTAGTAESVPFYKFDTVEALNLPADCSLVGIEITEDAVELPTFRHPRCAAYVLGAERLGLSEAMIARCDHVVQIPTKFSTNLAVAGALVMYDRLLTHGRFPKRPLMPGGPTEKQAPHVHGAPVIRSQRKRPGKAG
ncbi:MAG: RNA methyltransferase [Alphaproteobacteria bacterium]|nr:RNA methyltransferase [Alphaproteobacteria bacterium]